MPDLKKIIVQNFRNIELQELEFSPNINCISGGNGEGKTNLLDAIYYLSMTKSAFSASDSFNIRYGAGGFAIAGSYNMPDMLGRDSTIRFSVQVSGNEKKVKRDDKLYTKISEHIGVLPIVLVSPSDSSLVSESGEERRKFVNSVLSQIDREYLVSLQQYNRVLAQRNHFLKNGSSDEELLSTFDAELSRLAGPIFSKREKFCKELRPVVGQYYETISGGQETVGIEYRSDLSGASLEETLRARREKDRILKYTTAGIQRDDFIFSMGGEPIRRCGSQGQQKSFLVALKFAQYEIMKQRYHFAPMLLLDDLFDKLDMKRIQNLLSMVAGNDFGQIFLTDCDPARIKGIVRNITADSAFFEAKGGIFSKTDGKE
ncbi:MAG: DNA replication and repair protein RecF [Bacteroidales bacterium]|nr:DNA replication and repair protein RecF [Bacteroidales bacterium]